MVFNSVVFLFCFLPLALLAYYLVPGRGKNVVLLVESLLFYCWTGVEYLPLIVSCGPAPGAWAPRWPIWVPSTTGPWRCWSTWRRWSSLSMPIS